MRARTSWVTLGVILTAATALMVAQGPNPRVGTWHLNVAKSKYSPGPAPKSQVLTIEAAGDAEKVTSESISATGQKTTTVYTAGYDGKPNPLTGSEMADTVAVKRVDSHTSERTDSKNGKVVTTYTRTVSKDGKTMTVTVKGTNADGKPTSNVVVFEKR